MFKKKEKTKFDASDYISLVEYKKSTIFYKIKDIEGYNFDSLDLNLSHSGHDKPIKVAFENITVNAETIAETYEFELTPESRMDEVSLPLKDVKTMTFDLAVYDGETGAQIFEKTKVILGGETEAE